MKIKTSFNCKNCGYKTAKWLGKCPQCNDWNTFEEDTQSANDQKKELRTTRARKGEIFSLGEISNERGFRIKTNIGEFDRVLGGGIVPGSLILIGGDPGIGKSTLTLQMCANLINNNPLYITGEESLQQIKHRADRLKNIPDSLNLMSETNLETIVLTIKNSDCQIAVVDSIQSVYSDYVDSTPGSFNQVRECTALLMQTAKQSGKTIFIIGHVTKEGIIAGPKMLEHMVDCVLQFEGERTYSYRILRTLKNRYGSTNEIGIFDMNEHGLEEVKNPSEIFLSRRQTEESGVAIAATIEGSRPILLEIQALVTPTSFAVPQRTATGFDLRRLQMILAVLEKRLGSRFFKNDVFVNIAGGVSLNDPGVDLAVASALVSSLRDETIAPSTVIIGEIGLTGEVRSVSNFEQRVLEAEKLGFKNVIVPKLNAEKFTKKVNIKMIASERISLALASIIK